MGKVIQFMKSNKNENAYKVIHLNYLERETIMTTQPIKFIATPNIEEYLPKKPGFIVTISSTAENSSKCSIYYKYKAKEDLIKEFRLSSHAISIGEFTTEDGRKHFMRISINNICDMYISEVDEVESLKSVQESNKSIEERLKDIIKETNRCFEKDHKVRVEFSISDKQTDIVLHTTEATSKSLYILPIKLKAAYDKALKEVGLPEVSNVLLKFNEI